MTRRTTRREFMKIGAAALAGAALPEISAASDTDVRPGSLVCRTLGRTGLKLPIVSMGSSYAVELTRAALEHGLAYIHTSSRYGRHEELLGRAVKGRARDSFVVATSPNLPYRVAPNGASSLDIGRKHNPARLIESLENSLKRLGLDHVDIYYLASAGRPATVLHEPYWEAFERLKRDGKIRFSGVTTHANEPAVIRAAAGCGFWDVVLTAFNFRQAHREEVRAAIGEAANAGLGVVAMKTQAGVFWDQEQKKKINMVAALKWALSEENVHTTIPAISNLKELREDLAVAENPAMTTEEHRDLAAGDDLGMSDGFCDQCGRCLDQCPSGVEVPALMRSHMYACGHGQPEKARVTLATWVPDRLACRDCGSCVVKCPAGIDVRSRALDVVRRLGQTGASPA